MHILLITRHYPPEISGGARRPSLLSNALRKRGHLVTVVSPFELDDPNIVAVANKSIEKGMRIQLNSSASNSTKTLISRMKDFARTWTYWPDNNIVWARDVIRIVKQRNIRPDWIITTSPSESVHIAGKELSKYFGSHWLAEFRDTWVEQPHRKELSNSIVRRLIEKQIAKNTLQSVTAITAVSEAVMQEIRGYVKLETPELEISHFSDPPPLPHSFDPTKINLVHTGGFTLSDRRRELLPLLVALREIQKQRTNLVFHIAGPLTSEEISLIENSEIEIEWHGMVAMPNSRALQAGADGLILYSPENSHALPGKYAEYALAQKPILYFGSGEWLDLIEDWTNIRPLESGGLSLQKNEALTPRKIFTHMDAAKILESFLDKVTTNKPT